MNTIPDEAGLQGADFAEGVRFTQPKRAGVMRTKTLGTLGPTSAIGLGLMGMSDLYGASDRAESIATIGAALEAGITLLDTGDFYGMGHNEMLLGEALRGHDRDRVQISVKFGSLRGPDASWLGQDNRPAAVKTSLADTLQRLGTDHIDVYRPARLDPVVPIEDTVGAIAEMIQAGYVRHVGLSEVGADTIRRAHAVHPVSDLQIEYSLISRGLEGEILDTCRELGIGVTAYGVLSRGLISGHWSAHRQGASDFRAHSPRFPRFSGENLDRNLALVERLRSVATELGVSVAQVAIAWVAAQGEDIVPLVGARRRERLAESLGAVDVELTADQLAAIESAVPKDAAAGDRYDPTQMVALDSER
jgi:aryl-alcohol dehydrogenase-like predicted oxidoreductase